MFSYFSVFYGNFVIKKNLLYSFVQKQVKKNFDNFYYGQQTQNIFYFFNL